MTRAATDPYTSGMVDSLLFFSRPDAILGVAWTLRYEAVFYLLVATFLFPGLRFVGLLFVLLVGAYLEPERYQFHYGIHFLAGVFIAFARAQWGRVAGFSADPAAVRTGVRWLKGGAALVQFSLALYYLSEHHTTIGALLLILSYLVADFLLKGAFRLPIGSALPRMVHAAILYLGRISYSLYLVHTPVILFIMKRFSSAGHTLIEMVLVIVPVVLLSASVFHHRVEQYSVEVARLWPPYAGEF